MERSVGYCSNLPFSVDLLQRQTFPLVLLSRKCSDDTRKISNTCAGKWKLHIILVPGQPLLCNRPGKLHKALVQWTSTAHLGMQCPVLLKVHYDFFIDRTPSTWTSTIVWCLNCCNHNHCPTISPVFHQTRWVKAVAHCMIHCAVSQYSVGFWDNLLHSKGILFMSGVNFLTYSKTSLS